jgi:hypothetical protein
MRKAIFAVSLTHIVNKHTNAASKPSQPNATLKAEKRNSFARG